MCSTLAGFVGNLLGLANFLVKAFLGITVMIWARWTLPRLRIDQVITMCWKYCVPLAAAMFLGAMLWMYTFPGGVIASLLPPAAAAQPADVPPAAVTVGINGGP